MKLLFCMARIRPGRKMGSGFRMSVGIQVATSFEGTDHYPFRPK
jgi:hypothetical protein